MARLLILTLAVHSCTAALTTDLVVPENLDFTAFEAPESTQSVTIQESDQPEQMDQITGPSAAENEKHCIECIGAG